ncbi:MAG: response regulator [Candidatus Omnitrophota bacterium]
MHNKTILIVDDDDFIRWHLCHLIERQGVKVYAAKSGREAIDVYKQNLPDCVFLDINMPDLAGTVVIKKIKEIDPAALVYFVSGTGDISSQDEARDLGAVGFLAKPVMVEELLSVINSV